MKDSVTAEISEFTDLAEGWHQVANRLAPGVWSGIVATGLPEHLALDVNRLTWMRLADHIDAVEPGQVEAWLHDTARRECTRAAKLFGLRNDFVPQ